MDTIDPATANANYETWRDTAKALLARTIEDLDGRDYTYAVDRLDRIETAITKSQMWLHRRTRLEIEATR